MKVEILSPVEHDGKHLAVGDSVDLPADAADALIQAGAALQVAKKGGKASAEPPQE